MKPVFSRNEDIDKMAFLNWRIEPDSDADNLFNIANGIILSSIKLCKLCIKDNKHKRADILIFPILMNFNHAIELYLKGVILTYNELLKSEYRVEGKHNIKQIYKTARSKIKAYNGKLTLKDFDNATYELREYISELFDKTGATDKDDKMDFSRYPFSNKYEDHFYVLRSGTVEIDMENLLLILKSIKKKIDEIIRFIIDVELRDIEFGLF